MHQGSDGYTDTYCDLSLHHLSLARPLSLGLNREQFLISHTVWCLPWSQVPQLAGIHSLRVGYKLCLNSSLLTNGFQVPSVPAGSP